MKKHPSIQDLPDITKMNPSDELLNKIQICYCAYNGVKQKEISKRYNIVPRTIRNMLNKIKNEGVKGLIDKQRTGRNESLTPDLKALILQVKLKDLSLSCYAIAKELAEQKNVKVSNKTVERFLKSVGLLSVNGKGVKKTPHSK